MKRILLPAALILSLLAAAPARSESILSEHPEFCCLLPVIIPWILIDNWISACRRTATDTVRIMGRDAVFLEQDLRWHDTDHRVLDSGYLTEPVAVSVSGQNVTLREGFTEFHPNGMLAHAKIHPSLLAAGDGKKYHCSGETELYPNGTLKESEIEGEDLRTISLQGKTRDLCGSVSFHEDGSVSKAFLCGDETFSVANYKISIGRMASIGLYPSGKVSAFSANPVKIRVKGLFAECREASFDEHGAVTWCRFDGPTTLSQSGAKIQAGGMLSLYENGNIRKCTPDEPFRMPLKGGTLEFANEAVSFYENGQIRDGHLSGNGQQHCLSGGMKLPLRGGFFVSFHEQGALRFAELDGIVQFVIPGAKLPLSGSARFYDSGSILSADIAVPADIPYLGRNVTLPLPSSGFPSSGKLWFNREKHIIAVRNTEPQKVNVRGCIVKIFSSHGVIYTDYEKKEAESVDIYLKNIHVRKGIELNRDGCNEYSDTFVRAKRFWNDGDELHADGIEEVMFSEDATIFIDGGQKLCPAMEWVRLP